ncbi:uncharacterized protein LOC124471319 isoform X2 [Hypomesus transpacificus]|uniref:uncharacterized protein LOC124471319 isoform X2 n=1 Tax=Hypomesus transpacificus TaxID=137520 RepID=UPI001F07ADB0|nr:uncharacterized protein LOC124471319 isoform X2 [Hypomesus transpacificus]
MRQSHLPGGEDPEPVEALKFHEACAVARGGGESSVGFGQYKGELLKDLYNSKDKKKVKFVNWLRRQTLQLGTEIATEFAITIKYIKERDDRAARLGSATATSSDVASTSSDHTPSAIQPPPPVPAQERGAPGLGRAADQSPGTADQHARGHQAFSTRRNPYTETHSHGANCQMEGGKEVGRLQVIQKGQKHRDLQSKDVC